MSIVTETFLLCDGCGNSYGVDNRSASSFTHRINASNEGWKKKGNKDYCPNCIGKIPPSKPTNPKKPTESFFQSWEEAIKQMKIDRPTTPHRRHFK